VSGPNPYLLGTDEARLIFAEAIVPQRLTGEPQQDPIVVVVGGQPGAGKSRAQAAVVANLGRQSTVAIDADDLRPYHPQYETLALQEDRSAGTYCHPDAARWVRMAIDHAIDYRLDVVLGTSLGWAEGTQETLQQFRGAGYRVEVVLMAVHEAQSRLGILQRYQDERDAVGYGRLLPTAIHDATYTGVLDTADRVDELRLADAVSVYRRGGGQPLYANQLTDHGQWQQPPATRSAMETERGRPWTGEETTRFRAAAESLADRLPASLRGDLVGIVSTALAHASAAAQDHTDAEHVASVVAHAFKTSARTPNARTSHQPGGAAPQPNRRDDRGAAPGR